MSRSGADIGVRHDSPARPSASRRHRARRYLALAVAAGALTTIALAAADAWAVARDLRRGRTALREAATLEAIAAPGLTEKVRTAGDHVERAARRASASAWLGMWSRVPIVGREAAWLRDSSDAAASIVDEAEHLAVVMEPLIARASTPDGRIAALDAAAAELRSLAAAVSRVRLDGGWLVPPFRGAHRDLTADLFRARTSAERGAEIADGLRSFLGGPRRYLVLAANNAEMRSGGMVLQAGVVSSDGGRLVPGEFHSTADLNLREPVLVPGQITSLYGWLDPGAEWRNTGSSPNFPVVAPVYAAMAERAGLGSVDGVLHIDVLALRAMLGALGPVTVDGVRYTAGNVVRLVLHDSYVRFAEDQDERRLGFSRLAVEAFHALDRGDWSLASLARALDAAASGRHLIAWSSRPAEQAAWQRLHIAGELERDGMLVTVQNHGGNKLDWFLRPSVGATVARAAGGANTVTMRIGLENPTPPREVEYVAGDGRRIRRGTYRAFVAVYLPGWAEDVEIDGGKTVAVGEDGPMRVIAAIVDVPRGEGRTVTVTFTAPAGQDRLVLLPSARARPIPVRFGEDATDDVTRRTVLLGR